MGKVANGFSFTATTSIDDYPSTAKNFAYDDSTIFYVNDAGMVRSGAEATPPTGTISNERDLSQTDFNNGHCSITDTHIIALSNDWTNAETKLDSYNITTNAWNTIRTLGYYVEPIGTTTDQIILYIKDTGTSLELYRYDNSTGTETAITTSTDLDVKINGTSGYFVSRGFYDSVADEFYFLYKEDVAFDTYLCTVDCSAWTTTTTKITDYGTASSITNPIFFGIANLWRVWKLGTIYYIIDSYSFFRTEDWVNFTTVNDEVYGFISVIDNLTDQDIPDYVGYNKEVWKRVKNEYVFYHEFDSSVFMFGMGDWGISGLGANYIELETIDGSDKLDLEFGFYTSAESSWSTEREFTEGQILWLYTDNDDLVGVFAAEVADDDGTTFNWKLKSIIGNDFAKKITESYVGKTKKEMIEDMIDNYAEYLTYDTGITSDATTTDEEFVNRSFLSIIQEFDKRDAYGFSVRPSGECYRDTFTSSGLTITDSSGLVKNPSRKRRNIRYSKLDLEGSWNSTTSKRNRVTRYYESGNGVFRDKFPNSDEDKLNAIADALEDQIRKTIFQYTISIRNTTNKYDYGTTIVYTSTNYGVSADTVYLLGYSLDLINMIYVLTLTDSLFLAENNNSFFYDKEVVDEKIDEINVRVDASDGQNAIGSTKAYWQPCIFELNSQPGKANYNGSITNVDSTNLALGYKLPIPLAKDGLSLYCSGIQVLITDADATDYVDRIRVLSRGIAGTTTHNDHTTIYTSEQLVEVSFTAIDMSSYSNLMGYINLVCATASEIEIGAVNLEVYYE